MRVADRVKVIGEPLTEAKRAIAVRQDLPGLRDRLDAAVADFLDSPEYRKLYSEWYTAAPSFWTPGASDGLPERPRLFCCWACSSGSLSRCAPRAGDLPRALPEKLPGERAAIEFPTRVISRACGLIALALGLAVLLGWAFDVTALKTVLPGLFAMQPWAAITIALAGGALLVATVPGRIAAATSIALAGAVLIIGLQMLLQHATGVDFGTDRWFFPEAVGNQPGHPHPGRVAEVTSIAFVLLGAMLLLARVERAWARGVFSTIGTVGLLLMAAPLLGYLIGAGILQSAAFFTRSPCTRRSVSSSFSWARWRCARIRAGWPCSPAICRVPLRPACCCPLPWRARYCSLGCSLRESKPGSTGRTSKLGSSRWPPSRCWETPCCGMPRASIACIAPDWPRRKALRQSEERYRSLVEAQPDPICQFLPDTTLTFVNRAYAQFYGTEPEELIGRRWLDFAPKDERPRFLDELSSFTPEHPERHEETRSTRAGPGGALVPVSPLRLLR